MRNKIEALLMFSLTLMVALVAAAMILPSHPRLEDTEAAADVEATPAVFVAGVHAEPGAHQSPSIRGIVEPSGSAHCP